MANEFVARKGIVSLGNVVISGSIITTGAITVSGSIASASYALSASYASSSTSASYAVSSSYALSSSYSLSSSYALSSSYSLSSSYAANATTSSYALTATSASYAANATSASYANNATTFNGLVSSVFATTGSNTFIGTQTISGSVLQSGSFTTTGTIIAQTINVQTVTSSIVYSSGSNVFGNSIGDSQRFTGSVLITGSLTISTGGNVSAPTIFGSTIACSPIGCFATSCATSFIGGTMSGTTIYGSTAVCSAVGKFTSCLDACSATFNGNTIITSTGIGYFNGCLTIGSLTGSGYRLEAINPSCLTGYVNLFYGLHTGNNTFTIKQFGANHPSAASANQIGVLNAEQHLYLVTDTQACIDAGTSTKGIFLKSGGNVGIGIQSPSEKLEIYGALKISSVLCITGLSANSTYIDQTGGTARLLSYGPNSTTRGAITFFQASSTNACQFTGLTLDTSGNATFGGNICSGTISGTTIYGSTAVCSPVGLFSGCVGIGTASPSQKLHVAGTVHLGVSGGTAGDITGVLSIGNTGTYYMTQIKSINTTSNPGILKPRMGFFTLSGTGETAADLTEKMSITADTGYVGIGTCTPAYSLSVKSGWIHNYGAQNASGFRYENDASGHVLNLNANNSYAQLYTSTDTSLYFGTNNNLSVKISNTGETCFKCNVHFCGSTYGIMGFGEKVFDKTCYVYTTCGTICLPLNGLGYANGPTRAIYIYGSLLGNDSLQYAHMVYFYRNDYGGLQAATVAQASCAHASTAGQVYTYTVNDPGGLGKENCTLNIRLTSSGAGVSPGGYCTQMRIVVYNVPGL